MANDGDGPRPMDPAEVEMRGFVRQFTQPGMLQRCKLSAPLVTCPFVRHWQVARMPDGRYRAAVIFWDAGPGLPSLNMATGDRAYVQQWLTYAGIPVIRFADAFPEEVQIVNLDPTPES